MKRLISCLVQGCTDCTSPSVSGAQLVGARPVDLGRVIEERVARDCTDGAQQALPVLRRVSLVQRGDGKRVLIARRGNDDALAIDNQHAVGSDVAYQATTAAAGGRRILHDYRVPTAGGRWHFVVTDIFTERETPHGFIASPGRPSIACWLDPATEAAPGSSPTQANAPAQRADAGAPTEEAQAP
jgi:hypothetical protein